MVHVDKRHAHHFIIPFGADLSRGTPIDAIQVEVIPETVGRYTGLPDKNGVEVYEGDIVYNRVFKTKVEFLNGYFYPFTQSDVCCFYPDECEVIGNIHDNPELLEVQNEK